MMSELKKCPFCGEVPEDYDNGMAYWVKCTNKICPNCATEFSAYHFDEWQFRPIEDALQARIPQWISVKDRLPEDEEMKLIATWHKNVMKIAYYNQEIKSWVSNGYELWDVTVTHWMPIPEPPKENE